MSQKTLVLALGAMLLILLVVAGIAVGGGSLGLFGSNDPHGAARTTPGAANADPEQAEFDENIAGTDEHGPYRIGQGGTRVYRDEHGRFFIISPEGKRTFTDPLGRARRGTGSANQGNGGTGSSSTGNAGKGQDTGPEERKTDDPPADEEAKPASLSGLVQDDTGAPFAGAAVVAEIAGKGQRSATSGDEGQFAFADLPSGLAINVYARDARGNVSKAVTTRLAPGAGKLPGPLVLPRDTSIRGIVRSAESGSVLAGASVILYEGASVRVKSTLSTGGDGNFEFAKLLPAAYRVQVSLDGFAPRNFNSVEPPRDLDVRLDPGAAISGRVTSMQGEPLANARVACSFTSEPAQHFLTEAFTDDMGFYTVKCQPESQHNRITVIAAGFKSQNKTFVRSGAIDVNFALEATDNAVLRGRLLTKSGGAVTAATFSAFTAEPKAATVFQSVGPGPDGSFWVEVGTAAVELRVRSPGLAELRVPFAPVPGQAVELGNLVMDAGYAVFGVIREAAEGKKPIAGATVSVGQIKATTGEDGRYRIEGLGAEPFIVRVLHPAYLGSAVNVSPTPGVYEVQQDIELGKANFEARVLVKDAGTSGPLAGVKATATDYAQVVTTGEDGLVRLTGLSSMQVWVKFEKAGYASVHRQIAADVAEKVSAAPPQEVTLTRGARVHGICTAGGVALPAATRVEVWDTGRMVVNLLTDTEGRYASEPLPWGVYFVGLPGHGFAPRAVTVNETEGELNLEIGPLCHARGRLTRADGQPHANAGVYLYRRENSNWCATFHTDPDGKYEVMNLWPGEYVFCALKSQGDVAAQFAVKAAITAPGWNTVNVDLPQVTGVITGRVTYPDGSPVKGARVSVTNLTANFERALLAAYVVTDESGNYRAERLENGHSMIVRVGGYPDEAVTGTAFGEAVTIPSNSEPVESNLVVAPSGLSFAVKYRRADAGPVVDGPLCYLFDAQGRMAGLFFGGGAFGGNINLQDVNAGSYTLVVTVRGFKRASLNFTVGTTPPQGLEVLLELEERNPG
ncbi:MAG: carboxypeptidase regulatory-like domain-containing protein [Planctomycetes bacterium]|nr:carboxypeptidase regulatory-like domain-containing protein [Planctomycetota bacterium]